MQTTFNQEDQDKIINLYTKQLLTIVKISEIYNCSLGRIIRCLKVNNIKMRTHGESYSLNKEFSFLDINKEKSYLLGVIFGDGTLNDRRITISLGDL